MLIAAFIGLGIAVLLGAALALLYLLHESDPAATAAPARAGAPWPVAFVHVLFGIGGLVILLLALGGPPRGVHQGTSSFGAISATLIGLAALLGVGLLRTRLRGQNRGGLSVGLHAMLAIFGFVVLAAYVLV
jgi:hypothetical protein